MKIRVVSSKDEIDNLRKDEKMIHLTFRPSTDDIFFIVAKCPNLEAFHIPSSYSRSISRTTRTFLETEGIAVFEGDVGGHRKDISDCS